MEAREVDVRIIDFWLVGKSVPLEKRESVLRLLVTHRIELNAIQLRDDGPIRPLHKALILKHEESVVLLIRHGADWARGYAQRSSLREYFAPTYEPSGKVS